MVQATLVNVGKSRKALNEPMVLEYGNRLGYSASTSACDGLGICTARCLGQGVAHIAGNVNGKTIRQFPVVTEVAALYRRKIYLNAGDRQVLDAKAWLRAEWQRSVLPLNKANEACGVKNAATRKYLTRDWLWYWPPGESVEKMARYCTEHGRSTDWPYFSLDGKRL